MASKQLQDASLTQRGPDHALVALARLHAVPGEPLQAAFRCVAELAADALRIGRFSIWLLTDDHRAVRLCFLWCGRAGAAEGPVLTLDDFPSYFTALENARTLAVDGLDHPAVRELVDPYLTPLGIGALLDASIYRSGTQVGVVCHEHLGGSREWTDDDRTLAGAIADTVSRLFEENARLNAERSLAAHQQELMALSRLEGMGRLAAGVAHDFNNLLTVLLANLSMLDHEGMSADEVEAMRSALEAVAHGQKVSRELLQFGRDTTDRPAVHALEPIVAGVARLAGCDDRFRVEVTTADQISRVLVDRLELERALLNLLLNARDAMGGAGVARVHIGQEIVPGPGGEARFPFIQITDTGKGMDEATRLRMFEPFFTTKTTGTGLGLAIAQQVVARAGGTFRVSSAIGQGTTIQVRLPAIE